VATWNETLARIARELGVASYQGGPLELVFDGAPKICVEIIDDGATLAAHADLGAVDLSNEDAAETLERLLAANAPQYIEAGAAAAIDSVSGSAVLFRRFEDATLADEALAEELRQFAEAVKLKQDELRSTRSEATFEDAAPPSFPNAIRV
jgi:hypothetical protein